MGAEPRYKRPFDLAVVLLALLALLPAWLVLGLAIALAVRLSSPGPVLYRQPRLGRGGRVFDILKFRTMAEDAEARSGPVWAKPRDRRATPVGRVLRRFHLDELPQVVNVLRGEMSLVGPRPERPALAARIEREVPGFASRLRVRPGIAGLAQARGGYRIHPRDKLRYDLQYIEAMNPWLDLKLCAWCAWTALPPGAGPCVAPRRRAGSPRMASKGVRAPAAGPRPAAVRGNDWRRVRLPEGASFTPTLPVSVIVPCFEAPGALALTLAGLERQDYPRELFEVVIVDDGSEPPLKRPAPAPLDTAPLTVRVVRQERRGFGLARARNAGARAAAHGILVFLDGDVIAESGLLAAHARRHHAVSDALTLGFCAYVSPAGIDAGAVRGRPGSLRALFAGRPWDRPWLERHMARTGDLTSGHDDLFRAVTGHNLGISRAFFEEVGGFDETFTRYGGEDTEFGYRVQMRGGLLAPVRDAFAWHQGRFAEGRAGKARDQALQSAKLAGLIADPGFRRAGPGRVFAVPRHAVTVEARDAAAERIAATAEALLADPAGDLVVRIATPAGRAAGVSARLEECFRGDPRVRIVSEAPAADPARGAALDAFPASPFHIALPAGAGFRPGLVDALRRALGGAAMATATLADGSRVSIARAWALHRARRTGLAVSELGEVRTVPAAALARRRVPAAAPGRSPGPVVGPVPEGIDGIARPIRRPWGGEIAFRGFRAVAARVWAEARHVRGSRTAWRFLAWLAVGLRWRLGQVRGARAVPGAPEPAPEPAPGPVHADAPLGVEIAALGPRARAVFQASARVVHGLNGRSVDVALADTPAEAMGIDTPAAVLAAAPALSIPAFDPAVHNPVGWVREVESWAAALGPVGLLPPGVRARRTAADDLDALRHCHHVEDVAAFHAGAAERAGTLARLAASGVPVHLADRDPALEELLGAELYALMTTPMGRAGAAAREARSIRMRRAALRGHSLGARARQLCAAAGVDPPELPRVSVLLATRRPGRLAMALANVARQRYPRLELVLALHGPGFEDAAAARAAAGLAHPVTVLRVGGECPLGAVLNMATAAAAGPLLAKMDDDDVYGAEHLWDLVLAREYSGAALVGKFPATVYLARRDRTVRRRRVPGETWSRSITGGAMLIGRAALERAGGWRPLRRHVDAALVEDVARGGGGVYRTHDAGYILVRHGEGHTWEADDAVFLAQAETVRPGWQPDLAGIGDVPPPVFGPADAAIADGERADAGMADMRVAR